MSVVHGMTSSVVQENEKVSVDVGKVISDVVTDLANEKAPSVV